MKNKNQSNDTAATSGVDSSALLAQELLELKLKVKDFCIRFDRTKWGWDGDCGTQPLVDELEETVQDEYGNWTC